MQILIPLKPFDLHYLIPNLEDIDVVNYLCFSILMLCCVVLCCDIYIFFLVISYVIVVLDWSKICVCILYIFVRLDMIYVKQVTTNIIILFFREINLI